MIRNPKNKNTRLIFICIILSFLLWGCANPVGPVCIKDGKRYGVTSGIFRSHWDDYYERGLSYAEGECYSAAQADFTAALKGNNRDQWMARTFGMHFIDYFPHREIGIVHFYMGDNQNAVKELEISIQQKKTEKAVYYLNRVRKKILEEQHIMAGIPSVVFDMPVKKGADEIRINEEIFYISGTVHDENYVSEIRINGEEIPLQTGLSVNFSKKLKTVQGMQEIQLTAENLLGGKSEHIIRVFSDRAGPIIVIRHMSLHNKGWYLLEGYLEDDSDIISFFINGQNIEFKTDINDEKRNFFTFLSHVPQIRMLAKDGLGNETESAFSFSEIVENLPELRQREGAGNPLFHSLLALGPVLADTGYFFPKLSEAEQRPMILLEEWQDNDFTFEENILIRGQVRSRVPILSVRINGDILSGGSGNLIFFSHPVSMEPEESPIEITAEDESGSKTARKINIQRKKQAIYDLQNRYSLLIHPFTGGKMSKDPFNTDFPEKLFRQKRFQISWKDDSEIKADKTDNILPADQKKGIIDGFLSGRIYETRKGIEIAARMIDRKTSEILTTEDVYAETGSSRTVNDLAGELCDKLFRAFPLVTGEIHEIVSRKIRIRTGENRLKTGWPLIIYRPEPRSHRGSDTRILCSAHLEELREHTYGALLSDECRKDIQTGDRIIPR